MAGLIHLTPNLEGYQPGACNIGPAEIARRRRVGYAGMATAIGLTALLMAIDAPAGTRLLVALPVAVGLSGLLQARLRFCANYGWRGLRNLGEIGDVERVADAAARDADRRRALAIAAASSLGGLAVGVALTLLPI